MKTIWKMVIISIASGLVLSILGFSMGASRNGVYLDKTGAHLIGNNETRITEPDLERFKNIDMDAGYCNVEFVASSKFGIDIYGNDGQWNWSLDNETLRITREDKSRVSFFVLNTDTNHESYIKIYLPQGEELGTVSVKTSSGNVNIGDFKASSVQIENSYGNIDLRGVISDNLKLDLNSVRFTGIDLNAQNIIYKNSYGKGSFENIYAEKFNANGSSCDFELKGCSFGYIDIKNNYGKVIADGLYSSKTNIYVDSGDIGLNGEFLGETTIHSSYGDIKFTTSKEKEHYSYDISVSYGEIIFDNNRLGSDTNIKSGTVSENMLEIDASSGDIEVYFAR